MFAISIKVVFVMLKVEPKLNRSFMSPENL